MKPKKHTIPVHPKYRSTSSRIMCPICNCQCVHSGNVHLFNQEIDSAASQYFRLDEQEGVVAMHHDDPSRFIPGRLLVLTMHGECGHDFDLVFHHDGPHTLFFQTSNQAFPVVPNQPYPEPPPPMFLTPSLWIAFLQEMKTEDNTAYHGLLQCIPLLDRPRHIVLCLDTKRPQMVSYLRTAAVKNKMQGVLDDLVGSRWTTEVQVSHALNEEPVVPE